MDFIEGLPRSSGKEVILVVVDKLTKYAHFVGLSHPYSAHSIAVAFLDNIFKLHGMLTTIVRDRDTVFVGSFWKELFGLHGVELAKSTAYHPQTDGQTEVVNRCLETYVRCMTHEHHSKWMKWLALAEWWYNTNFHNSTQLTPFEAVYRTLPPFMFLIFQGIQKWNQWNSYFWIEN